MKLLSTYLVTAVTPLVQLAGFIAAAFVPDPTAYMIGFVASVLLWNFVVLRCPRCRSLSAMKRFVVGKRGPFNQYYGIGNPENCHLCGLDLTQHVLWERIPWNGERAVRRPN